MLFGLSDDRRLAGAGDGRRDAVNAAAQTTIKPPVGPQARTEATCATPGPQVDVHVLRMGAFQRGAGDTVWRRFVDDSISTASERNVWNSSARCCTVEKLRVLDGDGSVLRSC